MTSNDPQLPEPAVGGEPVREEDKVYLVLAYLNILALIPLLTMKDNPYIQWHARQGLVLGVGATILLMVLSFLGPLGLLNCPLFIGVVGTSLVAIIKALEGKRWRIPLVAELAEKF